MTEDPLQGGRQTQLQIVRAIEPHMIDVRLVLTLHPAKHSLAIILALPVEIVARAVPANPKAASMAGEVPIAIQASLQ
jgi:hypothetical protein